MHPRYKKTYLYGHKKIRVPTNSIISASDYVIAAADYRISRHLRKNYSERKRDFSP